MTEASLSIPNSPSILVPDDLTTNFSRLQYYVTKLITSFIASVNDMPFPIKFITACFKDLILKKFKDSTVSDQSKNEDN